MLSEAFQTKDGKTMLSYLELTFDGKNCEALNNMKEGDDVHVYCYVRGIIYRDKQTGLEKSFTKIGGYFIKLITEEPEKQSPEKESFYPMKEEPKEGDFPF